METNENSSSDDNDGKAAGIVSYFFIIGWLIAYFALHHSKRGLGSYQLRQTLLFHIISTLVVAALDVIFFYLLFSPDYWVASALNWLTELQSLCFGCLDFLER